MLTGMRRRVWVSGLLVLALAGLPQCATRYELAQKHINKAQSYYQRDKHVKSLKEFSQALNATGLKPDSLELKNVLAVIYHRLYLIGLSQRWDALDPNERTRLELLSAVLNQAAGQEKDLLQKAFADLLALKEQDGKPVAGQADPWLAAETEIIIAGVLARAAQPGPNPFSQNPVLKSNEFFFDNIRRYVLYDLARSFYVSAWLKLAQPGRKADYLDDELRRRLKETSASLVTLTNTLANQKRQLAFTVLFKDVTERHWAMLNELNGEALPADFNKRLGQSLTRELTMADPLFHFNTGRAKLSLAIDEVLAGKNKQAINSLLVALPHFVMAEQLQLVRTNPQAAALLNNALEDIYLRLHRLSVLP